MHCTICGNRIKRSIDLYLSCWFGYYRNVHMHCKNKDSQYRRVIKQREERFKQMTGTANPVAAAKPIVNPNMELTHAELLNIAQQLVAEIKSKPNVKGSMMTLTGKLALIGSAVTNNIQELRDIETRIEEYKKTFNVPWLNKRDMLAACNGGVMPNTAEALKRAEEKLARFNAVKAKGTAAKKAEKKKAKVKEAEGKQESPKEETQEAAAE